MKCGLPELNKDNVMFILDKHIEILEHIGDIFEEEADSIDSTSKVFFAIFCAKSIRADIRELHEEHSIYSRNEIIELLDEVNTQYGSNFKLKTMNIITATEMVDLYTDLSRLDACPRNREYVFDVEDIMPILKKKVEGK